MTNTNKRYLTEIVACDDLWAKNEAEAKNIAWQNLKTDLGISEVIFQKIKKRFSVRITSEITE